MQAGYKIFLIGDGVECGLAGEQIGMTGSRRFVVVF